MTSMIKLGSEFSEVTKMARKKMYTSTVFKIYVQEVLKIVVLNENV